MKKTQQPERGEMTNLDRLAEIEEFFERQNDEELDVEEIMSLLEELEGEAPAPHMFGKRKWEEEEKPRRHSAVPFVRKAVSVAAVAAICLAMSTTALGQNIINVVFDRNSEQIYIEGSEQEKAPNENALALRSAVDEISDKYLPLPTWIPEKYHLEHYEIIRMDEDFNSCDALFASEDGEFHIYVDFYGPDTVWGGTFEKDVGGEERVVGGTTCYVFTNMGNPVGYWNYGNIEVTITNNIPMEDLEPIIDSIK